MSERLEDKYLCLDDFEQEMAFIRSLPGSILLVAETGGRPIAYLIIRPRRPSRLKHTAELNIGVAQSARGQGVGGVILQAGLERAFASTEIEIVYLKVRSDNIPAIRLYRRMGFETLAVLHRDVKIDGCYFDGLLMRKFVK